MAVAAVATPSSATSFSKAKRPPINQLLPEEEAVPADLSNVKASSLRVIKSQRRLDLLDSDGQIIRSYKVSLGRAPKGAKVREGDNRTPEGRYYIDSRNENSDYYRSLRISYPSKADIDRARKLGVNAGGGIFIHGKPNGKSPLWSRRAQRQDWTKGCIAVSDEEIREIWSLVRDGTPITIEP
jgi:murein L,D-transpeptidase YafK